MRVQVWDEAEPSRRLCCTFIAHGSVWCLLFPALHKISCRSSLSGDEPLRGSSTVPAHKPALGTDALSNAWRLLGHTCFKTRNDFIYSEQTNAPPQQWDITAGCTDRHALNIWGASRGSSQPRPDLIIMSLIINSMGVSPECVLHKLHSPWCRFVRNSFSCLFVPLACVCVCVW